MAVAVFRIVAKAEPELVAELASALSELVAARCCMQLPETEQPPILLVPLAIRPEHFQIRLESHNDGLRIVH